MLTDYALCNMFVPKYHYLRNKQTLITAYVFSSILYLPASYDIFSPLYRRIYFGILSFDIKFILRTFHALYNRDGYRLINTCMSTLMIQFS